MKKTESPQELKQDKVVELLRELCFAVHKLGTNNASDPSNDSGDRRFDKGAVELVSMQLEEGFGRMESALCLVADAINNLAESVRESQQKPAS